MQMNALVQRRERKCIPYTELPRFRNQLAGVETGSEVQGGGIPSLNGG